MPVQHEAGAVAGAGQAGVDVVTAVGHAALVDVEAEFAQLGGVVLADFGLLHGYAGDLDQRLRLAGDPLAIDGVFEGCPLLLVLFHLHPLLSLCCVWRLSWSYHSMAIPRFKRGVADASGQTHLNSDAKIADEGRPQGAPFYQLSSFSGQETGLQLPKTQRNCDSALRPAQFQALCPEKGAHKGRPYPIQAASRGFVPI